MHKKHLFIIVFLLLVSALIYAPTLAEGALKVTLPEGLQPITAANAAQATEVLTFDPHTLDLPKFSIDGDMADNTAWLRAIATGDARAGLDGTGIASDFSMVVSPLIQSFQVITKMTGGPIGGQKITEWGGEFDDLTSAAISPDNKLVAVGDDTGIVSLWDVKTGKETMNWQAQDDAPIVTFTPDGTQLITGGDLSGKSVVQYWNPATGELTNTFSIEDLVGSLDFSPDGSLLAVGGGETIAIWDVAAAKQTATLESHTADYVPSVAFNPDGTILATGSAEGMIYLWDVASGDLLATLTGTVNDTDYLRTVVFLDFSPDGALLVSSERDGLLGLWGTTEGGAA